ncbi:hypothetical protein FACS1894142_7930 [Spirochaetia bacterium]|nr:hypothetical protein FACS1894142_7930 [Spirochaetia bacterium]
MANGAPYTYRPRLIDAALKDQLNAFGEVLLTGPKIGRGYSVG